MLAIVFALERFHQYVYGRKDIVLETDHKPLEALFNKSLNDVPARLQRMMLRVQRYDIKVVYKPGKYMFIADALSRAALPDLMTNSITDEIEEQSCFLISNVSFSTNKLNTVRDVTLKDEECQALVKYIVNGWPINKCDTDIRARPHWAHRETLEYIDGVLFKDNLVLIPEKLKDEMIKRIHEGHLGIERCKRRAREVMFWCGMSRDIEQAVRRCRVCQEHTARPPREPMITHQVPQIPWLKIGSDIFEYQKKLYLVLVDYFSNFIEINILNSTSSKSVISVMKEQFARHGIPQELITDNGPAYASKEFRNFCVEWGIAHVTSSPYYPQSNGLSERSVRTIKEMMKKASCTGTDFYLGLLNLRSTPRAGISSPSQLLMGRRLRTRLPIHLQKLEPERDNSQDYNAITSNRLKSKQYYDKHSRQMPELEPGDEVMVHDPQKRTLLVHSKAKQPRSYFLTNDRGTVFRRNRRHLTKLPESKNELSSENTSDVRLQDDSNDNKTCNRVERQAALRARELIHNVYNE